MKVFDKKVSVTILLTLLVLTGAFVLQKSYALVENVPSIVSFKRSSEENNALKVEVKSNNTGSDFSLEILNITKGTRVNVAGSVTSYTFQNLEENKEYEVMVRACSLSDNKYKCTDYSPGVKAIAGPIIPGENSNVLLSPQSYIYDGSVKTPSVTVTDSEGTFLTNDQDYTVAYQSGRVNVGTYTVTVTGKDNYSFEIKKTFKITPAGIKSAKLSTTKYTYNGKVKTPSVTVINNQGKKLTKNTHYTVKYPSGRKKVGTYTVVVKGKGNYSFTKNLKFTIKKKGSSSSSKSSSSKSSSSKSSSSKSSSKSSGSSKKTNKCASITKNTTAWCKCKYGSNYKWDVTRCIITGCPSGMTKKGNSCVCPKSKPNRVGSKCYTTKDACKKGYITSLCKDLCTKSQKWDKSKRKCVSKNSSKKYKWNSAGSECYVSKRTVYGFTSTCSSKGETRPSKFWKTKKLYTKTTYQCVYRPFGKSYFKKISTKYKHTGGRPTGVSTCNFKNSGKYKYTYKHSDSEYCYFLRKCG